MEVKKCKVKKNEWLFFGYIFVIDTEIDLNWNGLKWKSSELKMHKPDI